VSTAQTIIRRSLRILNVIPMGASVPGEMGNEALAELNSMISLWAQQSATIPAIVPEDFALVANQGGPSNPYTIGTGGDFNTARPPQQNSVTGARLLLGSTSPVVTVPLAIYTDAAYDAIAIPELTSNQPTGVYYNPTYAGGLGRIQLYPVPSVATNSLRLYFNKQLAQWTGLTQDIDLPDGYEDAIVYNLCLRLAPMNGRTPLPETTQQAINGFAIVCDANSSKLRDLSADPSFLQHDWRYGYNIETGNM